MEGKKPGLLVIDDEPDMRDMLSFDLTAEGYNVVTVASGQAAVEAVAAKNFDLAITDLRMPGMNGVDTLAAIKKLDPDIEVIIATAYSSVETAVECMHSGAFSYIQKPYGLDELRDLVKRGFNAARHNRTVVLSESGKNVMEGLASEDPLKLTLESAMGVLGASCGGVVLKKGGDSVECSLAVSTDGPPPPAELLCALSGCLTDHKTPFRYPSPLSGNVPEGLKDSGFDTVLAQSFSVGGDAAGTVVMLRRAGNDYFFPVDEKTLAILLPQVALAAALGEVKKGKT